MKRFLAGPARWVFALLLTAALTLPPSAASAQEAIGSDAWSLLVSAGRAAYERDAFCIDTDNWFTGFRLTVERGAFGLSVASVSAYPWPLPPPFLVGEAFFDRGIAYQVGVQVDPLRLLGATRGAIGGFVTPFVGGGLQISRDGEAAPAGVNGDEPTVAVGGGTDPYVTYGARLDVPLGEGRFGVFGEVRGTSVFDGGKDFIGGTGEPLASESETLSWAEFSLGVRLRLR